MAVGKLAFATAVGATEAGQPAHQKGWFSGTQQLAPVLAPKGPKQSSPGQSGYQAAPPWVPESPAESPERAEQLPLFPNVPFVVFYLVPVKQGAQFVLKRYLRMMSLLVSNVGFDLRYVGLTH